MAEERKIWPGESEETHPEVFTTIPPQPTVLKPGQFNPEQIKQFYEKGYLLVENYFDKSELEPVREDIKELVDHLANRLYKAGKIKDLHKEEGLFTRLIRLEEEYPGANILIHKYGKLPQAFRNLWSNERLLNLMEQLLNTTEIIGHPVWNLRSKTPNNEASNVPWHQDSAYLDKDAYSVMQPTAWIPFLDTNEFNGCMQMVEGGHQKGQVCLHQCCQGGTWYVMLEEEEIERTLGRDMSKDVVTCRVPYGGAVFFNNMIPHRSLNNMSGDVRWSMDLRWQRADQKPGFYGLKEGVLLRSAAPDFKIDWDSFDAVDRNKVQDEYLNEEPDEFEPTISGPWMRKWEIVHVNRHTQALGDENLTSWHTKKKP